MKNKKVTYLLLFAVVAIWSTILYKLLGHENHSPGQSPDTMAPVAVEQEKISRRDSLLLNYRDPFLEPGREKPTTGRHKAALTKSPAPALKPVAIRWPEIIYGGSIQNSGTNTRMALLSVNGKELLLREGEIRDQLHITRIFPDSVQMAYMNDTKMIRK